MRGRPNSSVSPVSSWPGLEVGAFGVEISSKNEESLSAKKSSPEFLMKICQNEMPVSYRILNFILGRNQVFRNISLCKRMK